LLLAEKFHPFPTTTNPEEARARTAISRAYYCAFNVGKTYVLAKGYITPTTPDPDKQLVDHQELWDALQTGYRTRMRTIDEWEAGRLGRELKRQRRKADYITSFMGIQHQAQYAIETSRHICKLLGQPLPKPPPGAVPAPTPQSGAPPAAGSRP
jgi:uncharacterized protein (UPF0332 family)